MRTGGAAVLRTAASGHWRERRPGTRRKRSFLLPSGLPLEWKTGTGWTEEEESRGGRVEVVVELLEDWVTRLNFVTCVLELLEVMELQAHLEVMEHLEHQAVTVVLVEVVHLAHLELQVNLALLVVTGVNQILVVVLLVVLWQDLNIPSSLMEVTLE